LLGDLRALNPIKMTGIVESFLSLATPVESSRD
jgi:hypothetical protein